MVVFGQVVISNEIFILLIFGPMIFAVWYYRRVLTARLTKIVYDDSSGDSTVYPAMWDINTKTVKMKISRKSVITLKKKANPKRVFVPPYSTQLWFRGHEGSNETQPWTDAKGEGKGYDMGYEVSALQKHWLEQIKSTIGLTIRNPMVYMAMMAGGGLAAMVIFLAMLFTGNI